MTASTETARDEARIRELIHEWHQAVLAKNVEALVSHYSPEVVVFDVVPPPSATGIEHYRQSWQSWFDSMTAPIVFEMTDVTVMVSGDLACAHSVNRVGTAEHINVVRATVCFQRAGGDWQVVHEHASVPLAIDMDPDSRS